MIIFKWLFSTNSKRIFDIHTEYNRHSTIFLKSDPIQLKERLASKDSDNVILLGQEKVQSLNTVWKVSKYGVISGPHFPAFSPNTGK